VVESLLGGALDIGHLGCGQRIAVANFAVIAEVDALIVLFGF